MEVRSIYDTRAFRPSRCAKSRVRSRACRFRQRSICSRLPRRRQPSLISKTLKSAVANAENNDNLKRRRPGREGSGRGRRPDDQAICREPAAAPAPSCKRTSHIRIVLTDEIEIKPRDAKSEEEGARSAREESRRRGAGRRMTAARRRNPGEAESRRKRINLWARKLIRSVFASRSTATGVRAGTPRRRSCPDFLHSDIEIRGLREGEAAVPPSRRS